MIEVYTDGSCLGNPGPGGWAAKCYDPEFVVEGGHHTSTNNICLLYTSDAADE